MAMTTDWDMKTAGVARDRNPDSFASVAEEANSVMADFLSRLGSLTDRLCGPQPPMGENANVKANLSGVPNGHFEEAAGNARAVLMKLEAAGRCLDRIERALP